MLYALGRRGAEVLDVPVRKGVGERYVAHQLMIGNVRIALTLASRERGIVCVWRSFPGGDAFPIRPDGFFSFQFPELPEGRNRAFFFLEADRSTMPRERFVEKLRRYEAWHAGGAHTAVLGIRSFRVLTVTKSPERLASLLAAVAAEARIERRRGYWFTGEADLLGGMAGRVFERVWQQPGSARVAAPRMLRVSGSNYLLAAEFSLCTIRWSQPRSATNQHRRAERRRVACIFPLCRAFREREAR